MISDSQKAALTYSEVGATLRSQLPDGYHHLRHRAQLRGTTLSTAASNLLSWDMHRVAGIRVPDSAPPVVEGGIVTGTVSAGLFHVHVPWQVVWVINEPHRVGFAYGTLPGHPECGEEAFLIEKDAEGALWFTVTAFSNPGRWYTALAGPLTRLTQCVFAHRYAQALQKLCHASTNAPQESL
jgi:uncharacterized protein (UPF0548 family)